MLSLTRNAFGKLVSSALVSSEMPLATGILNSSRLYSSKPNDEDFDNKWETYFKKYAPSFSPTPSVRAPQIFHSFFSL